MLCNGDKVSCPFHISLNHPHRKTAVSRVRSHHRKMVRRRTLPGWFGKLEQRFADRTLPLDAAILRSLADLSANAELQGRKLPVMDALLIATANVTD